MNRNKQVRWLYGELPTLIDRGIVDDNVADRLRNHYGPIAEHRPRALALLIFGILGAGLVGMGIILILANNWDELSRPLRAGMIFALLLGAQSIAAFALARRASSRAWNESTALFLGLCIGAAIALIGQTYNIPGDLGSFLLTWMLLAFPLMYLMDAGAVAIGYLVGITWWASKAQWDHQNVYWFWPLAGIAAMYLAGAFRKSPDSTGSLWLMWGACLCATIAPGFALEHAVPGLWISLYASLFTVMYLGGVFWFDEDRGTLQRPFRSAGALGLAVLSLVLTFEEPWDDVGWNHFRRNYGYEPLGAAADYIVTGVFFLAALTLLVSAVRRNRAMHIPLALAPILATAGFIVAAGTDDALLPWASFNIYVFVCSLLAIVSGVRANDMRVLNEGMLFLAGLIAVRFFDSNFSFVERGIAFIVIGLAFLAANFAMASRKRKDAA